ncbi:hypothetical protein ATO10_02935 [Actibacterium atlanticum]|uniref:Uncharacterized protein n=1 Tax=Actibacterium atlanticum TaxID=1461693 RepID=A0A058ZS82_9RHOB|nr:hypothetical protein ATO10_02935 [Actibacterium atlanticum]
MVHVAVTLPCTFLMDALPCAGLKGPTAVPMDPSNISGFIWLVTRVVPVENWIVAQGTGPALVESGQPCTV